MKSSAITVLVSLTLVVGPGCDKLGFIPAGGLRREEPTANRVKAWLFASGGRAHCLQYSGAAGDEGGPNDRARCE